MKQSIKVNDFVTFSKEKGFSEYQRSSAMQVMEVRPDTITVKLAKDGCMTMPHDYFEEVDDISKFKTVHIFENKIKDPSDVIPTSQMQEAFNRTLRHNNSNPEIKVNQIKYI